MLGLRVLALQWFKFRRRSRPYRDEILSGILFGDTMVPTLE